MPHNLFALSSASPDSLVLVILTEVILELLSAFPTMTLERHASIANSLRVLDGRLQSASQYDIAGTVL